MNASGSARGILLDTCAVIWLAGRYRMALDARSAIASAASAERLFVSVVSAWEIGMLSRPGARGRGLKFLPDPKRWFEKFMTGPGIREAPLTAGIAIDATQLPGEPHGDPADRLMIATARDLGVPIVTRDRRIIEYAETGSVEVVAC